MHRCARALQMLAARSWITWSSCLLMSWRLHPKLLLCGSVDSRAHVQRDVCREANRQRRVGASDDSSDRLA